MDTLFRSVSFQCDQSFNSNRTSGSSRSSPQKSRHQYQEQECCKFFMDEDDFSSSSKQVNRYQYPSIFSDSPSIINTITHFGSSQFDVNIDLSSTKWTPDILLQCAQAIIEKNKPRLQKLMWVLNDLGSPYGDTQQKLAFYYLRALFQRITGNIRSRAMSLSVEKTCSFESTRKTILKFQEMSPWMTFGHVASNGAILEAFEGENKLHVVDISNTYCTQWPTLLESLATRSDETPHLRLTTVVASASTKQRLMEEIVIRMEKFARLMGVPFKFDVIHHTGDLSEINPDIIDIKDDEIVAVNLISALHSVSTDGRGKILSGFRRLRPKILTVVEDEAEMIGMNGDGEGFVKGFSESIRWFESYFEALDECFVKTSEEKLMLERSMGKEVIEVVAMARERRESAEKWSEKLRIAGFECAGYSDEVVDDVRSLLKRYRQGWSIMSTPAPGGMFLNWKESPVVWASAWKV